jgi:molybdopterin biosynthesis enzyme
MTGLEEAIALLAEALPPRGLRHASLGEAAQGVLHEEVTVGSPPSGDRPAPAIPAGTRLHPARLAALRLAEIHTVPIAPPLTLAVACPTGDGPEFLLVEQMLRAAGALSLRPARFSALPEELPERLAESMVDHPDLVLAGVDPAWRDAHLLPLLGTLGFEPLFTEVSCFPGGRIWSAAARTRHTITLISGDIFAHLVAADRLLLPALRRRGGETEPRPSQFPLDKDVRFSQPLTLFAPARLKPDYHGSCTAEPLPMRPGQEAATLAQADGLLEFERYRDFFHQGEHLPFHPFS